MIVVSLDDFNFNGLVLLHPFHEVPAIFLVRSQLLEALRDPWRDEEEQLPANSNFHVRGCHRDSLQIALRVYDDVPFTPVDLFSPS